MNRGRITPWPALLAFFATAALAAGWQGRPVSELLDSLNEQGFRIIFSSDVVTDDLLVNVEPDLADPVADLRAELAAHGLDLSQGPGGVWLVSKARAEPVQIDEPAPRVEVPLPEIVVTSSLHRLEYTQAGTQTYLDRELATRIPAAAEEAVRITSRLPGTAGGGISSRSHVRGGEVNEVLFMLDGLRLYEPYHLKDFQSVATIVNSNALDGIDFFSGAFPAQYGDRMSGVMEMSLRRPQQDIETEIALSFFNTSALSMGTFGNAGQGEWLVTARRGNLDLIADVIDPDFGSPDYQDYLVHGAWEFGPRMQLSANLLASNDKLSLNNTDRGETARATYENLVAWVKWTADWSDVLRSTTILSSSEISNRRDGTLELPGMVSGLLDDTRNFDALALKQDWVYAPGANWMLSFGVDGKRLDATYEFSSEKTVTAPFDTILDNQPFEARTISTAPRGAQYGAYLEYRWHPLANLIVDAGLRWDAQSYTTASDDRQLSPRLSLLYRPGSRTELRLGWGKYSQAQEINELQATDGVDEFFPAQRAEHVVANARHRVGKDLFIDVSYYRKSFRSVRPRFENAFNTLTLLPEIQFDRYRIEPSSAEAQGAELRVSKGDGVEDVFWWLGYAWSDARDNINGTKVARAWDQTHSVKAGISWRWGQWDLSAAGEVHTGWPRTKLFAEEVPNPDGTHSLLLTTSSLNEQRHSVFHTLDARVSRDFPVRRGELSVFLEASNLYDRSNECCIEYSIVPNTSGPVLTEREGHWLPLVPSLGVVWRF
ncbi:MAG: TonB-dependent receptor [Gammaproteobacteria bacterium]|nr:TonB-dependent receptor [Gammaproteobacteria bacterium]